jgi:nucleoid-associated protein YgaU
MARGRRAAGLVLLGWLAAGGVLVRLAWLPGLPALRPWTALQDQPATSTLPLLLALAVLASGCWIASIALLTLLARLPGAVGSGALATVRRVSPRFLRRAVEVALGATTVLTAVSGVAQASTGTPSRHYAAAGRAAAVTQTVATQHEAVLPAIAVPLSLDRPAAAAPVLPTLDRPAADPARGLGLVTTTGPRTAAHQAHSVRVEVGDSLWKIAARSLPPGADDDQVERSWHRWYAANRAVIGDDPDLLLPGQLLTPPLS